MKPGEDTRVRTAVLPCSCAHSSQDLIYGRGMRLHNRMMGEKGREWRCSVCGKER